MPAILSVPVDTSRFASYFSHFPVRIHKDTSIIDEVTHDAIDVCTPQDSKERKQALYRHSNPYGNPYALCHGECDITKLRFFVQVVELIWIDDGEPEKTDTSREASN